MSRSDVVYTGSSFQLRKSHPKSWFESFRFNSGRDHEVMDRFTNIIVLQVASCGNGVMVVELVHKDNIGDWR